MKSFAAVAALGFAILFLGPSTSSAQAQHFGSQRFVGRGHGQVTSPGRFSHGFARRGFASFPVRRGGFARPFHRFAARPFFAGPRFRLERVFLYVPFPHWGYRRVYISGPAYGAFCDPY